MVNVYTGTPGSGKSLHCANMILFYLKHGKRVICNFPINTDIIKKKYRKNFFYIPDKDLKPHYLFEFAKAYHKEMREDQTYLIIDEAQRLFPIDRIYELRRAWEEFFQLHRHYGYSIILVTQNLSYINKGIRIQTEYEVKHRKINNYGIGGLILTILHIPLFVALTYWQGTKERIYSDFYLYKRKYGKFYNTFSNFDTSYNYPVGDESDKEQNEIIEASERSDNENLDLLFGSPLDDPYDDEELKEEIDTGSADFDEENADTYDWDMYIDPKELEAWKVAG